MDLFSNYKPLVTSGHAFREFAKVAKNSQMTSSLGQNMRKRGLGAHTIQALSEEFTEADFFSRVGTSSENTKAVVRETMRRAGLGFKKQ